MTKLNKSDLDKIVVALRLRVESCEDGGEPAQARVWEHTLKKVLKILAERPITRRTRV